MSESLSITPLMSAALTILNSIRINFPSGRTLMLIDLEPGNWAWVASVAHFSILCIEAEFGIWTWTPISSAERVRTTFLPTSRNL